MVGTRHLISNGRQWGATLLWILPLLVGTPGHSQGAMDSVDFFVTEIGRTWKYEVEDTTIITTMTHWDSVTGATITVDTTIQKFTQRVENISGEFGLVVRKVTYDDKDSVFLDTCRQIPG